MFFSHYLNLANIKNALVHLRTFGIRSTIRKVMQYKDLTDTYPSWFQAHSPSPEELSAQRKHDFSYTPLISIIVPVYKTPSVFLRQMLDSVTAQTYPNWELCIADGSADSAFSYISETVKEYQQTWPGIRYTILPENLGISGNTNAALALASGAYVALLDHDDILTPDALFEIVSALNQDSKIDVFYTDEDKTDVDLTTFYDPYFKPDFNLDLLRACNYITHFYVTKREFALSAGGFDENCNGSQDYDFILKTCDMASKIYHIPKILYHWRIHPASVAGDPESKTYAYDSAVLALQKHIDRCHDSGIAQKDTHFGYYRIQYSCPDMPLVSIITIDCPPEVKEQLSASCSYKKIEVASSSQSARGDYLLFLYNVKEIPNGNWLQEMLGNCSRKNVGLVGCKTLYQDRVVDAGIVFTPDGQLRSPFFNYHSSDPGYCYHAMVQQNCSFVGNSCFMIKASVLKQYASQPLEEDINNIFWDLCLKLRKKDLLIVLCPQILAKSRENRRHLPKCNECMGRFDPYYNPNFSQKEMYRLP